MKIHQLEVINFRGFEHQTFNFIEQFTVLIGENGTGKTAILNALATGANLLFWNFDSVKSRSIEIDEDDVRRVRYKKGQIPTIEPQYPVSVSCQGIVNGQPTSWMWKLWTINKASGRPRLEITPNIENISKQLQEKVRKGEDVLLPLVAYYGTGRLWLQKKEEAVEAVKPGSRMLGYVDCLDPASNQKALFGWFKTMEIAALQRGESLKILDAVKTAITNCLERGFWSVWITVFGHDTDMLERFINAFDGTCRSCFDAQFKPVPRPGGAL